MQAKFSQSVLIHKGKKGNGNKRHGYWMEKLSNLIFNKHKCLRANNQNWFCQSRFFDISLVIQAVICIDKFISSAGTVACQQQHQQISANFLFFNLLWKCFSQTSSKMITSTVYSLLNRRIMQQSDMYILFQGGGGSTYLQEQNVRLLPYNYCVAQQDQLPYVTEAPRREGLYEDQRSGRTTRM